MKTLFEDGNEFWKCVKNPGRPPKYSSSLKLWKKCQEYFDLASKGNFEHQKGEEVDNLGNPVIIKRRAPFTAADLCSHLQITQNTWIEWKKTRSDLSEVIAMAEQIIYADKFKGAVLGVFNARILSRDLGLTEKTETKVDMLTHDERILRALDEMDEMDLPK